jgi:sulfoxide reductase heme-binding subunit YedZ
MNAAVLEGPALWYLNRGSGTVTLVLLTATLVLGVLSLGGRPARGVPRFVTQAVHRNLALLAFALLGAHIVSAVVDGYVDIRWWQAVVPVGATYEPLWLGLGAAALDLIVLVVVTSAFRQRIRQRTWRLLHQLAWPLWGLSLAHGVGMGTDLRSGWWLVTAACAMAVPLAAAWRLALLLADDGPPEPATLPDTQPVRVLR